MDTLFNFGEPSEPPASADQPVREEQLQVIRREFERLGITSQTKRRDIIAATALREVSSLRELTSVEARRAINGLQSRKTTNNQNSGSAWDLREQDTWIDRI